MNHKITTSLASLMLGVSLSVTGCGGDFESGEEIGTSSEAVSTAFNPPAHGFRFGNTFGNNLINGGGIEIDTAGLCGGMVYSALDYYYAGKARPLQNYTPTTGTTLRDHIYARQVDSIESNVDKWTEIMFNPLGLRDSEFFKWGLQKEARVKELRAAIDAGKPVPLGLKAVGSFTGGHQVLAIGYVLGAYDANWLGYPNLKIMVYDPNFPEQIRTIVPNLAGNYWMDSADPSRRWLTYFVDANYGQVTTPNFTSISKGMVFKFKTGADDLQGGSHNVDLLLKMKDNSTQLIRNINASDRWVARSEEAFAVALTNPDDVTGAELRTGFSDRWLSDGWSILNIGYSVQSTPRISRIFSPPASYGGSGIGLTTINLPAVLLHARDGVFATAHEDSHAVYNTWGGAPYCVEIRGNTFHHAPYTTFCDWKNGHQANIVNYRSWGGDTDNWTATLNGKTFTHTKQGSSNPPHQSNLLSYTMGADKWQLKLK
jgi:hypothetical protein